MLHKTVIVEIRKRLDIPERGFPNEDEALAWYRDHYHQAIGKNFRGTFGFQYASSSGLVAFEYDMGPNYIKIYKPYPLDETIPLDRDALSLANSLNAPDWASPAFRLVILIGELPEFIKIQLPDHLLAPLGDLRVLVHPAKKLSLRKWRKTGALMGLLPGDIDLWKVPGVTTTYSPKRESSMEYLYWQTLLAYMDAIGERRLQGQKGKKGLLVDTARILVRNYGWNKKEDSYTIRRFLDRAEKIWHISTHQEK